MKTKSLYETIRAEFLASDHKYCCYCCQPQTSFHCCQENHFVSFGDLYPEDQQAIIDEEFDNAYKDMK
jgi:hypothetical protein